MIRDRRPEDLDLLVDLADELGLPSGHADGGRVRAWLEVGGAEVSWVYDMAPVTVAPTRNVKGHVVVHRPGEASPTPGLAEAAGRPAGDLLAIGRLCVRAGPHSYGIARHLLREARLHVVRQGRTPVLDLAANGASLTRDHCVRQGFVDLPTDETGAAPMVWVG